ncbi:MAG: hypothetical protein WC362_01850 [Methanoregula sp.]|jgi:hypothetical protein
MKFPAFSRPGRSAIILPGLLFGILYPAIFFVTMTYLEPTLPSGLKGGFLSLAMVFLIAPALLFSTGIASERLRSREDRAVWRPWIPYLAGFVGAVLAIFIIIIGMYMDQYVPYMEPGLLPRLAFVAGMELFCLPVLLAISTVFACFALAGGYAMNRRSKRADTR